MTIREIVGEGLHYARTCRSLWLFGFFVGVGSAGGSNGGGGTGGDGSAGGAAAIGGAAVIGRLLEPSVTSVALIASVIIVAVVAGIVLRFVGEGALIEGIVRARQGDAMTTRQGFRAGWAHWGVLLRIALLYVAAIVASVALLAAPCVIALYALGPVGGVLSAFPPSSSPCRGWSRCIWCRRSRRGSPCSKIGAPSTPSGARGSSCMAG